MSDLRPLRTLVDEMRQVATEIERAAEPFLAGELLGIVGQNRRCADALEALLDAHEAEIEARHHDPGEPYYFDGMMEAKAVREQILGARKP